MMNNTNKDYGVVALLPMKAHSSRVKGKNFRDFCGKPLFRWVLDTLLSIEEVELVVINTDARDILEKNGLVESERVMIRDRRSEICGDDVSMNLVLEDDVQNISSKVYLMTHTTNPLISPNTVRAALSSYLSALQDGRADSLFSVDKIQSRFYREDCSPVNHDPDNLLPTQALEAWFEENSNLYIFSRDSFMKTRARIGESPMMYETHKFESVDIDTPDDWSFAIVAAQYLKERN